MDFIVKRREFIEMRKTMYGPRASYGKWRTLGRFPSLDLAALRRLQETRGLFQAVITYGSRTVVDHRGMISRSRIQEIDAKERREGVTTQSILEKIRHLTAKTIERGCTEGEAQSAAEMVQKLLTKHNLTMVDLERKGAKKPGVHKHEHDLGKAAFKWKLQLADIMAEHYYCYSMTDWIDKRVFFVGRPENTAALTMLYQWVIDQIRRLAAEDRRAHTAATGEHIDPLRWQVNFGEGAAYRLRDRLRKIKEQRGSKETGLVLHHLSEISDWMEAQHGWRMDGKETAREQKMREAHERRMAEHEAKMANDPDYKQRYDAAIAKAKAESEAEQAEDNQKQARNRRRRTGPAYRPKTDKQAQRREQQETAHAAGSKAADRVNLEPFIEGKAPEPASLAGRRNT